MKILMCPPDHFSIDYEINPWMHKDKQVNKKLAQEQWERLVHIYRSLGVQVEIINPIHGLPDMVFTANAGLVYDHKVIISNFRYPERKPESVYFSAWFQERNFLVTAMKDNELFEGQGEALWLGDILVAGYGFRANEEGHKRLKEIFGDKVLSVKLIDPSFYHLDTCFLPIKSNLAAFFPAAFDKESIARLRQRAELIEISKEDADRFACNSVLVGKKLLMPSGVRDLPIKLQRLGFEVSEVDVSEFKKSGGGVRCLTLTLEA